MARADSALGLPLGPKPQTGNPDHNEPTHLCGINIVCERVQFFAIGAEEVAGDVHRVTEPRYRVGRSAL